MFDSDAIEDKCGVCKGDGTKCKPVEGVYNETKITGRKFHTLCFELFSKQTIFFLLRKRKGRRKKEELLYITYTPLFSITFDRDNEDSDYSQGCSKYKREGIGPSSELFGSENRQYEQLLFKQRFVSSSPRRIFFFHLYYLYSNRLRTKQTIISNFTCSVIERAGDYQCANSILMYIRPDKNLEEIFIKGPISEDLEFQVRSRSAIFPFEKFEPSVKISVKIFSFFFFQYLMLEGNIFGVHYLYYVMSTDTAYKPKYLWDFTEWSECSVRCAGGTMVIFIIRLYIYI